MHTEIELTSAETVLPASFAQQRMWFLERFEGGAVYNVPIVTRLRGSLDVGALERALGVLTERHESLRTVFTAVDGVPYQVIRPAPPFSLKVIDVSGTPGKEERAQQIASQEARTRFDLASEAPFRVVLIKLGDEEHLLSLTLHHIIVDGWSIGVLNRELSALYGAFLEGGSPGLPELPIQYADYAAWQQEWMASGGLDEQLAYWQGQLAGAPALLELPADRPRPRRQSFRGAVVRSVLPLELLERVKALGERQGATLFMTLLTGFAVLLSRYSGQEDVVVASPVANRGRTELEGLIGLFVNTLALRVELEGEPSFCELLTRVREVALGAFSNQDLPFEKLVEKLVPERHLSHAPVAQVMFVVQNAVDRPVTLAGLEHERVLADRGTAKFDLTFFAAETPEGLRLSLEYCVDLFDEATVAGMLEHFRVLLEAALAEPERPVGELALLVGGERDRVVESWNATAREYALARCVHELVSEQVRRTPEALAVEYAGEQLTYRQLEARADQLAHYLRGLGVGPDVVVAVCAERSIEMVIALLAVLKAGGAYMPIDPAYPEERVAFMLADTNAPVLLTQQRLVARLPDHRARIVCLDGDWEAIGSHDDTPPAGGATLENLAYVIYTSGSTGRPKGVAMSHRPLANLLAWQLENWSEQSSEPAARTLQFASLSFDVAFQEIFSTWCSGGTLVLADEEVRRDPEALLALLAEQRVERLFLPFVALRNLCEAADYLALAAPSPSLREVITAGEQLKVTASIRAFFARTGCSLVNQYGPTESHVVTAFTLAGAPEQWPELPPIGRPIANAKIYLLDRHRQPVPVGVPGELYIGGVSLARGYLGRPELTSERFVSDPFNDDPDTRLYRTGDLARYLPDGNIDYLGRADHQLKIRGFRVEPGEIESALRDHPAVREALAIARQNDNGDTRLDAYLISDTPTPSAPELRDHLHRSLPDYMIPSTFTFLDEYPLTPNGKVDRTQLAAMPPPEEKPSHTLTPPRTETEERLAAIWRNVLAIPEIGIHDNFFELGGHSLLATKLISRVRNALGLELPLRMVFEAPTVAGFAQVFEDASVAEMTAPALSPIDPVPREWRWLDRVGVEDMGCMLPASFAEQRLWFLDRLEPESRAYNLALVTRLRGRLDVVALERALSALAARHESLRTTFPMIEDVPQRLVRPPRPVSLPVTDLSGSDGAQERAQALVGVEAGRGFDLQAGPLLRAGLLRLGEDEHIFMLTLHHIVVDGWSIGVLNRELGALYGAFLEGRSPGLPELRIQYADFAAWQQEWMASGGLDEQLAYWQGQLAGAPALLELSGRPPTAGAAELPWGCGS